ncbi:hypothetical protein BSKO_13490 [Bryopsis sp. KO-2023]|nr:hypothetical protein BSKO_13490 [Bryopsis sp. KO-2023]
MYAITLASLQSPQLSSTVRLLINSTLVAAQFYKNQGLERLLKVAMTSKDKRYDRQLRIWGSHGQQLLENAKICLLNSGPTGSETLKNLVLGGIAAFTVVDDCDVRSSDLGNNFFVDLERMGQPRAKVVTELLGELNENVAGSFLKESPDTLIDKNPDFFKDFELVVATQIMEPSLVKLDVICRGFGVPLLAVRSYGLAGYLRVSVEEHSIIESRPDDQVSDLRLHTPWPELESMASKLDLQNLADVDHKHIPYVSLLLQVAAHWKSMHSGSLPTNSNEKSEFKSMLKSLRRNKDSRGTPMDEENFDEALRAAYHVWAKPSIPSEVKALLDDESAAPGPKSSNFWILIAALKEFVEGEGNGLLPLEGSVPDMVSTTDFYLEVQRVYRSRANYEASIVERNAKRILSSLSRDPNSISPDTIKTLCKNARNLRLIRCPTLEVNLNEGSPAQMAFAKLLEREDCQANASLYALLRAVDAFFAMHSRFPGTFNNGDWENDERILKAVVSQQLPWLDVSASEIDRLALEICRFGASEMHCVGSVLGGIAAQEAIKLITGQFVPLCGTLLYNAMTSTTLVLNL